MKNATPGQIVSEARKKSGLTQQQLAELLGVHFVTMSKIERGKSEIGVDLILKLKEVLGIPPLDLLSSSPHIMRLVTFGILEEGGKIRLFAQRDFHDLFSNYDLVSGPRTSWLRVETDEFFPMLHSGDLVQITTLDEHEVQYVDNRLCLVQSTRDSAVAYLAVPAKGELRKVNGSPLTIGSFTVVGYVSMTMMIGHFPKGREPVDPI